MGGEAVDDMSGGATLGQLDEHDESGLAFDQGGDLAVAGAQQQVAFPVSGHGPILDLGRAFSDRDCVDDLAAAVASSSVGLGSSDTAAGAQMGGQVLAQPPSALHDQP